MKKHIANYITGLRILFSIFLLFFPVLSLGFYIVYLLCGLSDMLDGIIARKTNSISEFGAKLDTISDFVFLVASMIKLLPIINIAKWLWVWIVVIAVIKIFNIIFGFFVNKKIVALHTKINKITGLLLFVLPFTLSFIRINYSFTIACFFASIAAIQEIYYIIKLRSNIVV